MLSLVRLVSACALLQCGYTVFSESLAVDTCIYPEARRDETVEDDYHGVKVKDPYRWLEDPYSNETEQFIEAENNITRSYLDTCSARKDINARLTELWNYPKRSCPERIGDRDFFFMNSGLQKWDVLCVMDNLDKQLRPLVDMNQLSDDETFPAVNYEVSEDSNTLAYSLSSGGLHFKDVATGQDYPEVLKSNKYVTMSWTKDNKGLFYSCLPTQKGIAEGTATGMNIKPSLCYHKLNTSQSDDIIVLEFPEEPQWGFDKVKVSDCGRYLIVLVSKEISAISGHLLFFADLPEHSSDITGKLNLTQIVFQFEAEYQFISNEGSVCTFRTNKDAPNYRLIQIDLLNPAPENWTTLVPENQTDVLDIALAVYNDRLVLLYNRYIESVLQLHDATTGDHLFTYDLPIGTVVYIMSGRKDATDFFYGITGFLTPFSVWHVDLKEHPHTPLRFSEDKVKGFDQYQYKVEQVFYSSKDGTKVPMFIISKKNVSLDGNNPTLLGYGGEWMWRVLPSFASMPITVLQNLGGIVAIPNIRGEYGMRWRKSGQLNKQNGFDDFQAAAEYLIREGYTRPSLITIEGEANGGLLVAACINQRPDLFGAAIVDVGVLDMLRLQKFGNEYTSEYGSSDNEAQFQNLLKYSPLHNIHTPIDNTTEYPATLVLTADQDPATWTVHVHGPLHSLKFIAALQHACRNSAQRRPLLARIDTKAAHSVGELVAKIFEERSDILCFMTQALGLQFVKKAGRRAGADITT